MLSTKRTQSPQVSDPPERRRRHGDHHQWLFLCGSLVLNGACAESVIEGNAQKNVQTAAAATAAQPMAPSGGAPTGGGPGIGGNAAGAPTRSQGGAAGSVSGSIGGNSGKPEGGAGTAAGGSQPEGGASAASGGSPRAGGTTGAGSGGMAATGMGAGGDHHGGTEGMGLTLPNRVLLYHYSQLNIPSVPNQLDLLAAKLTELGFESERSKDPAVFSAKKLAEFGAVAMVNTCFRPFGDGDGLAETAALKTFVEDGGGLFGTHCAAVTYREAAKDKPHPYNVLFGGRGNRGYFEGPSTCRKVGTHPTIDLLPETFSYTGNLDNADYVAPDSTVLVHCRWSGDDQREVAVSWVREPGQGRVFFANFAKTDDDLKTGMLSEQHLFPGLAWVLRKD